MPDHPERAAEDRALEAQNTESALVNRCTALHYDLMRAGLIRTGHAMHEVVREIGWEVAMLRTARFAHTITEGEP